MSFSVLHLDLIKRVNLITRTDRSCFYLCSMGNMACKLENNLNSSCGQTIDVCSGVFVLTDWSIEWSFIHTLSSLTCLNQGSYDRILNTPFVRVSLHLVSWDDNQQNLCVGLSFPPPEGSSVLIASNVILDHKCTWQESHFMLRCVINPAFFCLHNHEHCCSGWNSTFHC